MAAADQTEHVQATRRVRLTADRRREQIIEEAATLIAQNGYYKFSIFALAERCGLSRAGVLHHVGSKEQLLLDVLSTRDAGDAEVIQAALSDASSTDVRSIIDEVVERNSNQRELVRLYTVLGAEALDENHPAHAYFQRRHRGSVASLARLLDRFGRRGEELAVEVVAYLDGLQVAWLRDPQVDMLAHWNAFADQILLHKRE